MRAFLYIIIEIYYLLTVAVARHDKLQETFRHFTINQWIFDTTNTERVYQRFLNAEDKKCFNFDFARIEWYVLTLCM